MPRLTNSVVMVTGGCGFIGAHLVRKLAASGASKIFVVDSLSYGTKQNLGALSVPIQIIPFRLGQDAPEELAVAMAETDYLFHLAAEKHNQSQDNPRELLQSNIRGTLDLFELAARHRVRKVVFSSSLYAYGRMTGLAMSEDEPPSPRTLYGLSKLAGEMLLCQFRESAGLEYVALRYFFVYGPRQYSGQGYKSVIVKNFDRILEGKNPVICGDGQQMLDYVYVEDVVRATVDAMERGVAGELFNVASGVPRTIARLTEMMLAVSGSPLKAVHETADWTAGTCRTGNPEKFRRIFGWSPATPLEEGLRATWEWMKGGRPG